MRPPYTLTPNALNVMVGSRMRTIDKSHVNFEQVLEVLRTWANWEREAEAIAYLSDLVDIPSFVAKITEGRIQIGDGIRFDGKPIEGVIVTRMMEMYKAGFDVRHLARFLDNLQNNPSETAKAELYIWLEHSGLPITEDGHFLAWKKVRDDYLSYHDGRTSNKIGDKPTMPRSEVNPDRSETCSRGLHFCAYSYLRSYYGASGRVMICKINPADVVAIPNDYNNAKGRAWTYEIVGEVPEEEAAQFFDNRPVVSDYDDGEYGENGEDYDEDEVEVEDDHDAGCSCDECAVYVEDEDEDEDEVNTDAGCSCDECDGYVEGDGANGDGVDQITTGAVTQAEDIIPALAEPAFEHRRKTYVGSEIIGLVTKYGQRGFQRLTGVPRTTLQEWLKKLS